MIKYSKARDNIIYSEKQNIKCTHIGDYAQRVQNKKKDQSRLSPENK